MNDPQPASTLPLWQVHPRHATATRRVLGVLAALALVQGLAWLMPAAAPGSAIPHYLLLHGGMEVVSIVIALMVFAVGWNADPHKTPGNVVLLACAFFVVGWLDLSHTFAYPGMPDLVTPNDTNKHLYFWLSARAVAALALLAVVLRPWTLDMTPRGKHLTLASLLLAAGGLHWVAIQGQDLLPAMFVPGSGLTPLKKGVEYAIIGVNLATMALLWRQMRQPLPYKAPLLLAALGTLAMGEFFFTLYTTMTGAYNVLGHAYKVIGYLFIYRAVVVESVERPYLALQRLQDNLELAVRASQTGLWDWNLQDQTVSFSPVWKAQLGYTPDELSDTFETWRDLLHPNDREQALQRALRFAQSDAERSYESEFRMRHKDGSYHWILARGEKQFDDQGRPWRLVGSHTDLTDRKRAEDRFQSAVQASPTGMIMVDEKGCIVLTNSRTDALFGHPPGSLVGQSIEVLIPHSARPGHAAQLQTYMAAPTERKMGDGRELSARRADGSSFRVEVSLTPIVGSEGRYVLASVVDLTDRLRAEQRINQLIHFDPLTGLPNRHLLNDRIGQAIALAARDARQVAVLFLDIDHFKNINDTLGHRVGDLLLVEVARRLQHSVREADTVARVGGDEFVVVLTELESDTALRVGTKLLRTLSQPYAVDGQELAVTPSIGIAVYPEDGTDFETLYQRADTAMYRVKEEGRNDLRFFTREMQQRAQRMHQLESAMNQALARQQFFLQYQPQLSMDGQRVVGVEALLRWRHPELGLVSPAEFIPVAESNGQIVPIGAWVLRTAIQQLRAWVDAGMAPLVMAVNLSAVQFRQPQLPDMVSRLLAEAELAPEYLELELTEGVAMMQPAQALATMDQLHARGIRLSIDDFGTGYSSLSYLKKFSVYKVKIDQSFVRDIVTDADDRAIVSAIVQMAHSLGFLTIAEGVETQAQRAFLQAEGCDEVQGYLFSRPLDAERIPAFVQGVSG